MIRKNFIRLALACTALVGVLTAQADEGMWLMQQLGSKYPEMKKRGLKLAQYDIYNPNGTSLRDAVVIFDRGCTGEIISSQGLVLTNHHCGYDAIQSLSSVEKNYLEHGFWAQSMSEELPARGVTITFIDAIEDVTDYVKSELRTISDPNSMAYLSPQYLAGLASKRAGKLPKGTAVEIKAFYNGNRYLMFTKKIYSDIRFVGAPPSSIGKFGADTDNWAYPRHTGDFSLFRIYADANGNPADYAPSNQPLRPKRWFNISTGGVKPGDFMMIMGFPGRTNRFFLPKEVEGWKTLDNDIRIRVRAIRQEVMLAEMLANAKTNIKYAAKYAYSQNGYKRSIGANWGVEQRRLDLDKARQMQGLLDWSKGKGKPQYAQAVEEINRTIDKRANLRRRMLYILESFIYGTEFIQTANMERDEDSKIDLFFKDFDPEVDKKITKAILTEYLRQIAPEERPAYLQAVLGQFPSSDAYVDAIFASKRLTAEGLKSLRTSVSQADELTRFTTAIQAEYRDLMKQLAPYDNPIDRARRIYVAGLIDKVGLDNLWPDANSTLRFTFGNIKGYSPRDGVEYAPQTYLDGVMQKADSTSWEFAVPNRLKEIYDKQTYGKGNRWAERTADGKWRMPVNFCATTHTTGGNSGSPVFDGKGNLIGINFDRNWEGVGGDIQYLADYQRSIICDIRYILMIIEEYGRCPRLIDEMSLVK